MVGIEALALLLVYQSPDLATYAVDAASKLHAHSWRMSYTLATGIYILSTERMVDIHLRVYPEIQSRISLIANRHSLKSGREAVEERTLVAHGAAKVRIPLDQA